MRITQIVNSNKVFWIKTTQINDRLLKNSKNRIYKPNKRIVTRINKNRTKNKYK